MYSVSKGVGDRRYFSRNNVPSVCNVSGTRLRRATAVPVENKQLLQPELQDRFFSSTRYFQHRIFFL